MKVGAPVSREKRSKKLLSAQSKPRMKILTVVSARPQFIKAAPVSKALREAGHTEAMVHTGSRLWRWDGIFLWGRIGYGSSVL